MARGRGAPKKQGPPRKNREGDNRDMWRFAPPSRGRTRGTGPSFGLTPCRALTGWAFVGTSGAANLKPRAALRALLGPRASIPRRGHHGTSEPKETADLDGARAP
eukprot:7980028-Pyramimonas_sp.AAC.1